MSVLSIVLAAGLVYVAFIAAVLWLLERRTARAMQEFWAQDRGRS